MSKASRAVTALNECADALEALPPGLRRVVPLFGGFHYQPGQAEGRSSMDRGEDPCRAGRA